MQAALPKQPGIIHQRLVRLVRDPERRPAAAGQPLQRAGEQRDAGLVKARPRLVKENQQRFRKECACQPDALALTHREPLDPAVGELDQLELLQYLADSVAAATTREAGETSAKIEILHHRQPRVEPSVPSREQSDHPLEAGAITLDVDAAETRLPLRRG